MIFFAILCDNIDIVRTFTILQYCKCYNEGYNITLQFKMRSEFGALNKHVRLGRILSFDAEKFEEFEIVSFREFIRNFIGDQHRRAATKQRWKKHSSGILLFFIA